MYDDAESPGRERRGAGAAAAVHTDHAYQRLTRSVDLTGVDAADEPALSTRLMWGTEPGDDVALMTGGTAKQGEGFETSLGAWRMPGPPPGSPAALKDWTRTGALHRT